MQSEPATIWKVVELFATFLLGAGGLKLLEYLFTKKKSDAETNQISRESGLKAFQVADDSLAEWMRVARTATRDLMLTVRQLNQAHIFIDEAISVLEKCASRLEQCGVDGVESLKKEIDELITERNKMMADSIVIHMSQSNSSGAPDGSE